MALPRPRIDYGFIYFRSLRILSGLSCGVLELHTPSTASQPYPIGRLSGGRVYANPATGFGLAFAAFVQSAATAATIAICITYCIDTYPDLSGETMITVIVIRNTMGWAITSYA